MSSNGFDREADILHVVRQVRVIDGKQVFGLPKRNRTTNVPLAPSVMRLVDEHVARFPPPAVTLPWCIPSGAPMTVKLLLTDDDGNPMWRNRFKDRIWNPAPHGAGVTKPTWQDGTHALRHNYASVLLDVGEGIKALSEYLGHHDPGFTLRTYTHPMPNSSARTQRAIDSMFTDDPESSDDPTTSRGTWAGA